MSDQTPTPAQLREDADELREAVRYSIVPWHHAPLYHRAAAALEEQAARMEKPTAQECPDAERFRVVALHLLRYMTVADVDVFEEACADAVRLGGEEPTDDHLVSAARIAVDALRLREDSPVPEARTTELRGWGVMWPNGTLMARVYDGFHAQRNAAQDARYLTGPLGDTYRAVPVRLVLDDTESAAAAQEGRTDGN
jgi:hypothetical protein